MGAVVCSVVGAGGWMRVVAGEGWRAATARAACAAVAVMSWSVQSGPLAEVGGGAPGGGGVGVAGQQGRDVVVDVRAVRLRVRCLWWGVVVTELPHGKGGGC